jgi:cell division protein FtsI (penicillin-binding protein 3)/stage V sporulation protein D (sporulation-specific penicillin-binding protein)
VKTLFVSKFRYYLVFFGVVFAFCSVGGRLIWLQVWNADKYAEIASNARKKFQVIKARRGDVVDSKGNLLATTRSVVDVGLDPHVLVEEDKLKWDTLCAYLDLTSTELQAAANLKRVFDEDGNFVRDKRWVKLREDVDEGTHRKIQELKIKGIYGNYKHSRLYPNKKLASHLLGYVNKEGTPSMGVERFANYYLKGQDGWRESEKDGKRREMPHHRSLEVSPSDGLNVELSIDRRIQDIVEEELEGIVGEFNPLSASIIVSDPSSGYMGSPHERNACYRFRIPHGKLQSLRSWRHRERYLP